MRRYSRSFSQNVSSPRVVRWFWWLVLTPCSLLIFLLLLAGIGAFGRLPSFEELENPKSNLATEIYSEEGEMIGSFYVQNRSWIAYDDLSPHLIEALVATEDKRFYNHSGIDFIGLARVAIFAGTQGGGSTITQQLAKNLFPRDTERRNIVSRYARTAIAKLKEWIVAVKLEHNYTKEEIIAMYLNTVFYGANAYGIRSAAQTFFAKSPSELNIEESAMLVGVVNAPTAYNPKRNPERALARRNLVLERMRTEGYLSRYQLDSIRLVPIDLTHYQPISHDEGSATYFREMLRAVMTAPRPRPSDYASEWDYQYERQRWDENPLWGWCEKNKKADGSPYDIYRDGIKIYTTLNASMQRYAEQAVHEQLRDEVQPAMDRQIQRTGRLFNLISPQQQERIIHNAIRYSDRYREMRGAGASEAQIERAFDTPVEMEIFSYRGPIDTILTPRDSVLYHKRIMRAAFMAADPITGHIKAYVGGPDYRYFKYDMVGQGKRQVGSTIKPFIYTFAIDHLGLTPCTMAPNLQTIIETENGEPWSPKEAGSVEYDGAYHPLRWGLALSRNNYSAWVMKQAGNPTAVADFIHRLGIHSYIDPVWALCLGTPDVSLWEMVGAYGLYANRGVHTEPIFVTRIEDRHGNILSAFTPVTSDAISEQTAYTMLGMLQFVVSSGTAGKLRWAYGLTGQIGGKTGTTQHNADAWFMGIAPRIVAGAWVGAEDPSIYLYSGGEGSVMALPIYGRFMQLVYADKHLGITPLDEFPIPENGAFYNCADQDLPPADSLVYQDEFFD